MATLSFGTRAHAFPRLCCLFACTLSFVACAGAHFDGKWFVKPEVRYRVGDVPKGFERVEVEGSDLAFHRENHGTIGVNATCREYDDVPATALINHLLFGTTERTYVLEDEVTLDGRGVRHVIIDCALDGVPVRAEIYLLSKNGCVFDLSYISGRDAPAHAAFTHFVAGFHVERAGHD